MSKHKTFTVLGKPFLSIGGQTHNSSSYEVRQGGMELSFQSVKKLGGNTIAVPLCWDAFEPHEGEYDTGYLHAIIDGARRHGLHVVLLWFATWKNGTMEYVPAWVKTDKKRFPRVRCRDGAETPQLSSHAECNRRQDELAFCKLAEALKAYDGETGTVIGIQVENEPGIFAPTRRDFSEEGERVFRENVPRKLIDMAKAAPESYLGISWAAAGNKNDGSWQELFGEFGAEACTAWSVARYIDSIAEAAKEIYDIFLYTNVWLGGGPQAKWDLAGLEYPSGGAVDKTLEIWYAACTALDAIAPDIYLQEQEAFLHMHRRYANPDEGWPLYVPESHAGALNSTLMFHAIGNRGAIGYHIFGSESCLSDDGELLPGAQIMFRSMEMLTGASSLILRHRNSGDMHGLYQLVGQSAFHLCLRNWQCCVSYDSGDALATGWVALDYRHKDPAVQAEKVVRGLDEESGRGLLFQVSENEFFLVGHKLRLFFNRYAPQDGSIPPAWLYPQHQSHAMELLLIEEGHFEDENFVPDRRRSGDEARHGIWAQADCGVIHFILQ